MKIHSYHESTSTNSTRRPSPAVEQHVNFEVFHGHHKGKFLNSMPASHEPCRDGFRPYLTEEGVILGVQTS